MPSKPNPKSRQKPPLAVPDTQAAEVFPTVRYFQIHFEFLQEQIQLILRNQEALQQQMQQLESRLSHSGHGIRPNQRSLSPLKRMAVKPNSALADSDASGLNCLDGR